MTYSDTSVPLLLSCMMLICLRKHFCASLRHPAPGVLLRSFHKMLLSGGASKKIDRYGLVM